MANSEFLKKVERFIVKNNLSKGAIVMFQGNPKQYVIKNLHNDGLTMFVTGMDGLGIWNKRISNIIKINNKQVMFEDLRNGHNELTIDWSELKDRDLQWLSEALTPDFSAHAVDRAIERSNDPLDVAKEEISNLIHSAKDQLESYAGQFKTFVLKGKNNLNVVGSLIKRGFNYVFKIITVMWKKNFFPNNPDDKVILAEVKEIRVEDKLHDKNSIESKLKKMLKSEPSEETLRKFAEDNKITIENIQNMIWKLTSKLLNSKELKEMEISSGEGDAAGLTVAEIAAKHNLTEKDIQSQLAIGIPIEAKEHTYDLKVAKKICLDHLAKNGKYYSEYISTMELNESKLLKEEEPINVDETIADEPQPIVSEETEAKVTVKRDLQDITNRVEDIIINAEEWHQTVSSKINALERLGNILKALNSLTLDMSANISLVKEGEDKEKEVKVAEPVTGKEKRELLFDKSKNPISDELENFNYDIEDVEDIIRSHYAVTEEDASNKIITISVRNPKYDASKVLSTMNYTIKVYYGKNHVGVYAEGNDPSAEAVAHKVEKEIIQDLAHMSGYVLPDNFVDKHQEPLEEAVEYKHSPEVNSKGNDLLRKALLNLYNDKSFPDFRVIKEVSNEDEKDISTHNDNEFEENYEFEYEISFEVEYKGSISELELVAKKKKTVSSLARQKTEIQPEEFTDSSVIDSELKEVYFEGERLTLEDDTKAIIRNILKLEVY